MVYAENHADILDVLAREYFLSDIRYVSDLKAWAHEKGVSLSEPAQPLKIVAEGTDRLVLAVQSAISEKALDAIITGLDVRWQVVDNTINFLKRFDSIGKKLAYCFFKEYARNKGSLYGDERLEDEWAVKEMERLGFFGEGVPGPGVSA